MSKSPAVYITTNKYRGTLYVGVTAYLLERIYQHKQAEIECFTKQYGCNQLVYYEFLADMPNAIAREKQLKGGSRKKKIALIESINSTWKDLYEDLL